MTPSISGNVSDPAVIRRVLTTPASWAVVGLSTHTTRTAYAIAALLQSRYSVDANRGARALSPRELSVLSCVAAGLTNGEIGVELGIAADTVKTHVARVLEKLGARDRTQAASMALRIGLFP